MTPTNEQPESDIPSASSDDGPGGDIHPEARHADGRKTFLEKYSTTILCISLFFTPLIILGSVKSLKVYANDVRQWLPSGFEEAKTYDAFTDRFGIDEMVVMSWEGCELESSDVAGFQDILTQEVVDGKPLFARVVSGPDMIAQVESSGVSNKTARRRVQGLLVGEDKKTTCIIGYPSRDFYKDRRLVVERIYELAQTHLSLAQEELKIGGPTVDGAMIDIESKKALGAYLWMSIIVVFLLTWYRMRDLPLTLLVIFFASLCASVSLTILYWSGGQMNLTMVMLPTLTFILGVSGCVHMVNYYRKAATLGYGMNSADQAIVDGGYPVALSSTTTAIGLASLGASSVVPIKLFGFYSACGIMASVAVMLLVLPATLYLLRGRISKRFSAEGNMSRRERTTGVSRSTSLVLNWVCRSHWTVVGPAIITLAVIGTGILKLEASVKIQNRFANKAKIISDYVWLEENMGPLVPMEVELHFNPENKMTRWEQMEYVQSVENAIKQTTAVNASLSVATFKPSLPSGSGIRNKIKRKTILDKWEHEFGNFQEANLVHVSGDESFWRISLRVAALNDIDYGGFLGTVSENVTNQIKHLDQHGVSATLTGGIPLIYKAQHQILRDLMYSFSTAFLLITVIMIFVLRDIRAGLVAMIPNIFPPLIVFGAMGWLGFSIEIGSVMTASVALGIAVDDTLHFLTWYRRGTQEGLSRYASIRFAFEHCAKAMIDTSLICGLGVLPFLFGVFMPTVKFASLLMIMLFTALLGDLILLPAILAGPAGLLFRLRRGNGKKPKSNNPKSDNPKSDNPKSDNSESDNAKSNNSEPTSGASGNVQARSKPDNVQPSTNGNPQEKSRVNEQVDERVNERGNERVDGRVNKRVDAPEQCISDPFKEPIKTIRRN